MPRRRSILNVRSTLERTLTFCNALQEGHDKGWHQLGDAFLEEAKSLRFICKQTLAKHQAKGTRKDIYVERP